MAPRITTHDAQMPNDTVMRCRSVAHVSGIPTFIAEEAADVMTSREHVGHGYHSRGTTTHRVGASRERRKARVEDAGGKEVELGELVASGGFCHCLRGTVSMHVAR